MTILLNGTNVRIGHPLPIAIHSCTMQIPYGLHIPSTQTPAIKQWLTELKSRLVCDYIVINNCIMYKNDLVSH